MLMEATVRIETPDGVTVYRVKVGEQPHGISKAVMAFAQDGEHLRAILGSGVELSCALMDAAFAKEEIPA
jgi:hypothetical protein